MLLLLPRIRAALGALLVGSGALLAGSGVSLAAIRDFPLTPGNAPRPYSIGVERGAASEGSPQPPLRLAASRPSPGEAVRQHSPPPPQPPKHAVPPPPQHADKPSKDAEPKRQDADKPQPKDAPPKQQDAAKKQAKDAEAHRRQADAEPKRQDADKPPVKDSDRGAPEKAKEHPTVSGPKQQEPVKPSPRELEAKQQDKSKQHLKEEAAKLQEAHKHQAKEPDPKPVAKSADAKHRQDETKQHDKEKESKHAQQDAAKQHEKDADARHQKQDDAKQHDKEKEPKHAQQDATKQHEKDAEARHQKQDDAKQHEKEKETKHAQSDGSKSRDKDSEAKQHSDKQDSAKDHGKDTDAKQHHGKKAEQEKAAKEKAEAEAAAKAKAEADAKAKADAEAAAKAKSVADAAAAAKAKADADAAKAKLATTTTPQPTDSPKDAPATTDSKTADATAAPADSAAPAATGAPQSVTTAFADTPAKLGGPVQDTSTDAPTKTAAPVQQVASAPDGSKDRARKADDRGGVRRGSFTLFAPSQETYHANQFLAPKPSPKLLAEMEKRGYALQPPSVGDAVLVTLPSGAGDAWDVQRELESKFPDQRFGLNYIYKPYHPQQGTGSRTGSREGIPLSDRRGLSGRCTEEVCYGRKLIDWRPALGACAAGLKIGLIDTLVDRDHPAFAKTRLDIVNLALKNDAPPAPHWHATGVLSVLAGDEKRSIPSLIPRAEFTAVNVFFTNKNGELETDTAHLTEALAYLDEKVGVPIVNMSLVGPKDDLVHKRITDMATGRGVVFVAAAGNGGPGAPAGYPAAYDEVIAVTAVDSKGGNYGHANRGDYIDLAAPGVQILTSLPGGTEGFSTGTSFATPFVTAVVAAAYRDAKIGPAGRDGLFNPKRVMLDKLLGKEGLKKRDPILGYGLIKAPSACGSQDQPWLSVVKATPAPAAPIATAPLGRLPAASIAIDTWRPVVEQASLPSEATH